MELYKLSEMDDMSSSVHRLSTAKKGMQLRGSILQEEQPAAPSHLLQVDVNMRDPLRRDRDFLASYTATSDKP